MYVYKINVILTIKIERNGFLKWSLLIFSARHSLLFPAALKTLSEGEHRFEVITCVLSLCPVYFQMHPEHARKGLICQFQRFFYRNRCLHHLFPLRVRRVQRRLPYTYTLLSGNTSASINHHRRLCCRFQYPPFGGLESFCSPTGVSYRVVRP